MRILTLAREDLRLTLRDKSSIFWIFIAPFLWVFFFGFMSRPSDPTQTKVGLTVIVQEASPLADRFVEFLKAENFDLRTVKPGEEPPKDKEAPARTLTIPVGFEGAIARREKVELALREERRVNPEGTFAVEVALHKAIVRLLAAEALDGLEPAADAVRVTSSWAGRRKIPAGHYQTIPGNMVMFTLISCLTYGSALLAQERKTGILSRLATSPLSRGELLIGKWMGRVLIASLQVAIFILIGLTIFRIDWGGSPPGLIAVLLAMIACAAALGFLGGSIFTSPDAAAGVGVVLTLIMAALGGCWWPAEVMPDWMRLAGHAFPAAWAMDGLHQVISWGGGLRDVLVVVAVLTAYGAAAGLLAVRLLRIRG
jgi:ABC-type Na+ efflux pump permease subunit